MMSLLSKPVSGILRESSLGLFDHINKNAGSYSPSGLPIEVGPLLLFEEVPDTLSLYSRVQEQIQGHCPFAQRVERTAYIKLSGIL